MNEDRVILAVDLGTSGAKVALITLHGRVLGWESQDVPLYLTPDGGAEQIPEDWWQAIISASRRLLARNLVSTEQVTAVCCSTQGEGTVPVDKNGQPLMNCILWMDMRGAPYLRQRVRGLVNVSGYDAFKLLRWINLTGGLPSLTGKDPSAHMLLIKERFPEVYEKTYKFLNVLDFINLRLCGRFTATYDSILTSWVTDNRDSNAVHYDETLIKYSGIDRDKFPEVVPCTEVLGTLSPAAAEALGLPQSVKVVAGAIDNTAAAIGAGTADNFAAHLYIGTSSWIAVHVPQKKTDIASYLASTPCAVPGRFLLTALQATAGGNLTFLKDKILYHKDELLHEAHVPDVYKIMDQIAERVPAGSNGVLYTPWIWGERAPVDDRLLRAGLYNLSLNNTREDIIRAFLEGVAFNTRWLVDPVEKFIGRPLEGIRLAGGGGNSRIWCQIFADILNMPVHQVKDPIQANARGAALIAAAGLGEIQFDDVKSLVSINHTYTPQAQNRALYDHLYHEFVQIYRQMSPIFHRLNQ
ncbi:MAG TPA: FGGY-family carbohydrate kinase [Anaerolineaceae bacterium]|nr:FGGY-family carbohydrate kinase [Anaerolineaceae bacterium]HPN50247.1 FGGY-family carbohydrate kinase [Anaerolineaceae bacterium]